MTQHRTGTDAAFEIAEAGVVVDAVPAMFPGLTRIGGELVASFSTVPDGWPGGTVGVVRSGDEGRNWSAPQIVATPAEGQDAVLNAVALTTLRDGTLLLPYNGVKWTPGQGVGGRVISAHLLRSTDGGRTWTGGERLDLDFYSPAVYGEIVELADGRLLWPVWGQRANGERWRSAVLVSTDAGRTWTVGPTIAFDPDARLAGPYASPEVDGLSADGNPDLSVTNDPAFRPHSPIDGFNETTVLALRDGHLLAVLRQQGIGGDTTMRLFRAESADAGQTWSPFEPMGFTGMSPLLHRAEDGSLLLATRRCAPEGGPDAPGIEVRRSHDGGRSFSGPLPLADPHGYRYTAEYQCGYPAMANLPGGEVLVTFYSFAPNHGRFVAWNKLRLL
ncbi:sialidase family protein [Dactylosporangium sp. AC04546]|uniref:sialidase family protein n=1 Tax=Dactylosporangium sp. AC04546 TaxID=2862460 RepID=UPI001EDD873C|nr:sialidase family protein [Dactylosporangium sp. AC04546]WVK81040.1 sialidase family protein [Dactylosporangium sp. AC04546]